MDRKTVVSIDIHIIIYYIISVDLKSFMQRTGISQTDLAKQLNVTQATISYWSSGKVSPSISSLKQLIFMGMTIGEVFDAETEAFITKKTRPNKKQLCKDVVETALASVVGGEGKINDKAACVEIVLTGLEEIFTNHEK